MSTRFFLYGTLCDPELFEIVSGTSFHPRTARLPDVAIRWVDGESFPVPVPNLGGSAAGAVVEVDETARARLDFYELGFGYRVEERTVSVDGDDLTAMLYVPEKDWPVSAPWSLSEWQARHGELSRLAAVEYMGLMGSHGSEEAARAFPQVRSRAASRLRAGSEPSPLDLEPKLAAGDVFVEKTQQPYTDYFAVREDWLSFKTFRGGESPIVKRASFLGGDAVTVLPYDPKLDAVLVVRQFRYGAFARGDNNPWCLEPAAGRIDPGETPEETAHRELVEETGVEAGELHFTGRYYPSPGAYSEYIYSYVATADLGGTDGGVGGLEDEAEDIMRHVLPLDEALAMIETGAINTGPLILGLMWLKLNREKLSG